MKLKPPSPEAFLNLIRVDFLAFMEKAFQELHVGKKFLRNWHHEAIAWELEQCKLGKSHNLLLVTLPPRHLKSEMISVYYTAWIFAHDPGASIISLSYGADLVKQLSRDTRKIMNSAWYKKAFPLTRISASKSTETEFETTAGGRRYASTSGGELTGHGGKYVLIDDPHNVSQSPSIESLKADAQWFQAGVWTRFEGFENGAFIVLMQRYHPNDLAGYLIQDYGFRQLKLEAIAVEGTDIKIGPDLYHGREKGDVLHPEWRDLEYMEKTRAVLGEPNFQAQFQQDPTFGGGCLYNRKYFDRFQRRLPRHYYEYVVVTCDPASSLSEDRSYTVFEVWAVRNNQFHLLYVFRGRKEFEKIIEDTKKIIDFFGPSHVVVEETAIGPSIISTLRKTHKSGIYSSSQPTTDKLSVAEKYLDIIVEKRVLLPQKQSWLQVFEEELFAFPGAPYDDQVDAMNLMFKAIKRGINSFAQMKYEIMPSLRGYPKGQQY